MTDSSSEDAPIREFTEDQVKLIRAANEHLEQTLADHELALGQVIGPRAEATKSLITLASGALVLSFAAVQIAKTGSQWIDWRWMIGVAWFCFGLCTITGVMRLQLQGMAQSLRQSVQPHILEMQVEVAQMVSVPYGKRAQLMGDAVARCVAKGEPRSMSGGAQFTSLGLLMLGSYAIGIASLVAFAIRNL